MTPSNTLLGAEPPRRTPNPHQASCDPRRRFPTYEAGAAPRRRRVRAAPDRPHFPACRRGGRGRPRAADADAAGPRASRRCARRSRVELERTTGAQRRSRIRDPRHERRHAGARRLLPVAARAGRRGRRADSLLLLRRADQSCRRRCRSTCPDRPRTDGAGTSTRSSAAIGARTRALLLCNPGQPDRLRARPGGRRGRRRVAERHGLIVVTDEAYEAALWEGAALASAFGLADDVVVIRSLGKSLSMPQLRIGMLAGPAGRVGVHARRSSGTASASASPRRRRRSPRSTGPRDWLERRSMPALAADRDVAIDGGRGDARARGGDAPRGAVPLRRAPSADGGLADELEAVGLPVVDGAAFQAPGYARLPFGGAAEATHRAAARARPLGRLARPVRAPRDPRRTTALIGANSLSAAVQGQFQFVLPWMLLAAATRPRPRRSRPGSSTCRCS